MRLLYVRKLYEIERENKIHHLCLECSLVRTIRLSRRRWEWRILSYIERRGLAKCHRHWEMVKMKQAVLHYPLTVALDLHTQQVNRNESKAVQNVLSSHKTFSFPPHNNKKVPSHPSISQPTSKSHHPVNKASPPSLLPSAPNPLLPHLPNLLNPPYRHLINHRRVLRLQQNDSRHSVLAVPERILHKLRHNGSPARGWWWLLLLLLLLRLGRHNNADSFKQFCFRAFVTN